MLFEVILELLVKPEKSTALKHWLDANLPQTRAFDGCVAVHALESEEDPHRIVLIGFWQSRTQWAKYFQWREDRGDFEVLAPMLQREPVVACYKQFGEWRGADNPVPPS